MRTIMRKIKFQSTILSRRDATGGVYTLLSDCSSTQPVKHRHYTVAHLILMNMVTFARASRMGDRGEFQHHAVLRGV